MKLPASDDPNNINKQMTHLTGRLYVVATPIGNLADMTYRAISTLTAVDLIAAEDTRHIQVLLNHYGIKKPVLSYHQHNEAKVTPQLIAKLKSGAVIALVSDAGTPLISDPGLPLVAQAHQEQIPVIPIPGACALITALSVAGLPVSEFKFVGFLPRTSSARQAFFHSQTQTTISWIFYESSHRILACLEDLAKVFPSDHLIVLARELTKLHETVKYSTIIQALNYIKADSNHEKGEFVVIVSGRVLQQPEETEGLSSEQNRILKLLLQHCSTKTAAELGAEITDGRKKLFYQAALHLQKSQD